MKPQFDNQIMSSFLLWFDHIQEQGEFLQQKAYSPD